MRGLAVQFRTFLRKFEMKKNLLARLSVLALTVGAAASSQAAGIDVTAIVASIGEQAAPIALIGGAVLVITVAVKAFKWVRSAL